MAMKFCAKRFSVNHIRRCVAGQHQLHVEIEACLADCVELVKRVSNIQQPSVREHGDEVALQKDFLPILPRRSLEDV
jgi:hypothetical protein